MAEPENLVQVGFEVDVESLRQDLSQAEQLMQQGVQRLNALGQQEETTVISSPAGGPPPLPPLQPQSQSTPTLPSTPQPFPGTAPAQPDESSSPVQSAWEEFKKIQEYAKSAPDVALSALGSQGGLQSRITRGAIADPEQAEAYQGLIDAIKDLTKEIRTDGGGDDGGPAAGILRFMRGNALVNTVGAISNDLMQGNLLGAGGSAVGGALGFAFGGPLGAQAGASLGNMAGSTIGSFLGGADEARQYSKLTADIAARFGDFDVDEALSIPNITGMESAGYSPQETAQMFDQLRQGHVIDGVDEESRELVESLQALTRATGINTDALVNQYSSYRTAGGEESAEGYMAQVIAGAVASGMRGHLQEYSEMLGSSRMQLVYRSGMGDYGDEGMKGIQGILSNLLGQNNRTSDLLQDNPMMAQQMLSSMLATGASRSGLGVDASLMQMAGIDASQTTEGYISPGQQTENALARQAFISQTFLQNSLGQMGFGSESEFFDAAQANPNLVQDLMTNNPNSGQARGLQTSLDVMISTQMGKPLESVTAQDRQISMQMLQAYGSNNGNLTPETITANGESLADLIVESQQTEGQKAREAEQERHDEMMKIMERFAGFLTSIDQSMTALLQVSNRLLDFFNIGNENTSGAVAVTGIESVDRASASRLRQEASSSIQILQPMGVHPEDTAEELARRTRERRQGQQEERQQQAEASGTSAALLSPMGTDPMATSRELARRNRRRSTEEDQGSAGRERENRGIFSQLFSDRPADDSFNDTPPGGVQATEEYNTFRFAPGDVVQAAKGGNFGSSGGNNGGGDRSITVNVSVPSGAGYEWVENAAYSGIKRGDDEFVQQWRGRDRGGVSIDQTNY
jgi:hypothetical protein